MRITILFILLLFAVSSSQAQRIPSDCTAPDSVAQKYKHDATRLALRRIFSASSPYQDSIRIPKDKIDEALRPLLAVYNLTTPERDTVIKLLDIHTEYDTEIDFFHVGVSPSDSSEQWAKNLWNKKFPTGNKAVDSLMNEYGMSFNTNKEVPYDSQFIYKEPLNFTALRLAWQKIPGISFGLIDYFLCAPDIFEKHTDSSVTLTYYYGWEPLTTDCIGYREWYFTIFPDCSVQFDSAQEWHRMGVSPDITTASDLFFYPNPTSDKLTIELPAKSTLDVVDVEGKIILSTLCQQGNTEISVSTLPKGMYFLRAMDKNGRVKSAKFMKE